jgi:hypothetical protein
MLLTRENRITRNKTGRSAILSTTRLKWAGPESNLGLRGRRSATNHQSHSTVSKGGNSHKNSGPTQQRTNSLLQYKNKSVNAV